MAFCLWQRGDMLLHKTNNLFGIKTFKTYLARKIKVLEHVKTIFSFSITGQSWQFSEQSALQLDIRGSRRGTWRFWQDAASGRRGTWPRKRVELVAGQFGRVGLGYLWGVSSDVDTVLRLPEREKEKRRITVFNTTCAVCTLTKLPLQLSGCLRAATVWGPCQPLNVRLALQGGLSDYRGCLGSVTCFNHR